MWNREAKYGGCTGNREGWTDLARRTSSSQQPQGLRSVLLFCLHHNRRLHWPREKGQILRPCDDMRHLVCEIAGSVDLRNSCNSTPRLRLLSASSSFAAFACRLQSLSLSLAGFAWLAALDERCLQGASRDTYERAVAECSWGHIHSYSIAMTSLFLPHLSTGTFPCHFGQSFPQYSLLTHHLGGR